MKISIKILAALWLFLQVSCVKDNSVVASRSLDSIKITGIQDTISISIDEQLSIQPAVTAGFTPEADLEYLWYAFTPTTQFAADTLSKEKELDIRMSMAPGTYSLVLKVTDKSTGIFYKSTTTLHVVNDYTTGLIILTATGGNAGVHFLNTVSGKFIEDAYSKGNDGEMAGREPVSVSYYPQVYAMPSEIVVLCADERGGVIVNPVTFRKNRDMRNSFIVPWEGTGNMQVQAYVLREKGLQDYLIIDGQLHNRAANAGELMFRPAMLGDYYLAPASFNAGATRAGFYDNLNERFLCHNNTSGSLNPYREGATTAIIDPGHVGLKLLYSGVVAPNEYFGVFEDDAVSARYLLRFRMNSLTQFFLARDKFMLDGMEIMQAARFASSADLPDYFFYSVGGSIYAYNILSKSGGLLLEMGTGYQVNLLKLDGTELKVGYTNSALPEKKGGFATYDISTLGGIHANETRRKEGFCDKVIDITNKS